MSALPADVEQRINRLQSLGIVDLHFDLPMDLYEKRDRRDVLATDFLPQLEAGGIGVIVAAVYIEDRYLPDGAVEVARGQLARLNAEVASNERFAICRNFAEMVQARDAGRIAVLIALEGAEPLGRDLDLLHEFYECGLRMVGLTHARANAAASGGIFAASGSPAEGLTAFGRELVRECERLGLIIDLAHINAAGFEEVLALTTGPVIVSHTNPRHFYDIERNISDEQIRAIGERGGVIGINSVLVSPAKAETTLDRYVDHIEYVSELAGADTVAIGFDFFAFIYKQWPEAVRADFHRKFPHVHFIPDLQDHSQARNLTSKLIERGFSDGQIEQILCGNAMRALQALR